MITVEIYTYESGIRVIDKKEYSSVDEWYKDKMLFKLSGQWVGEKIYEISLAQFNELNPIQRHKLPFKADFDKEAYVNHGAPHSPWRIIFEEKKQ